MILKRIKIDTPLGDQTNCYIIVDENTKDTMVIDPAGEYEKIEAMLKTLDAKLKYIVLTHCHGDHIGAVNKLKENMFCKKIDSIETAAKLYGEDRKESFTSTYEGNRSRTITVKDLIDSNDLKKDNSEAPYIIDPRNNEGMDAISIIIYEKYNRIYVHFNDEINSICDK